jgi:hypothetical protein
VTHYATRLPAGVVTYGRRIGVYATALGEPFMPWQAAAADLIGAVDPDRPESWRYPLVVITVPRQAGKSTLLRAVHLDRLVRPSPTCDPPTRPMTLWMTAQTGKDARKRFAALADRVDTSPALKPLFTRRNSVGSEALRFGPLALSPFAPTPKALHGETTAFVSIDEAWAFDEAESASLLAAITPTMQNEAGRQLIIISTAGTHRSRWLWELVKAGRASLTDPHSRIAYIEHSADARYADTGAGDPLHPDALAFHPAIGHVTTTADILGLYDHDPSPANIRRSYLNLWPSDMDAAGAGRDLEAFDRARVDTPPPIAGQTVFAFDVAADRSGGSIYAATPTRAGVHIELVETAPGVAWLPTVIDALPGPVWHDPTGYTGSTATRSTRRLETASAADLADATAAFLADLADNSTTLDAPPELRTQYEHAKTRSTAGAGFVWDIDRSPAIDHLRAASLALLAARRNAALPVIAC